MGAVRVWVAITVAVVLASCGKPKVAETEPGAVASVADTSDHSSVAIRDGLTVPREFDEDQARDNDRGELDGTTYVDSGASYGCTEDCSGHEAGFAWAQENEVTDASECGGDSASFREGCEAYAEALEGKVEEAREEGSDD